MDARRVVADLALVVAVLAIVIFKGVFFLVPGAIVLFFCACELIGGGTKVCELVRNSRKQLQTQYVRINLRYEPAELKRILEFAKANDVAQGGRYDLRGGRRLNIWTHVWCNSGCMEESCRMFCLDFDLKTCTLLSVALMPRFDWQAFVDELAMLERAAVGQSIYGSVQHGP